MFEYITLKNFKSFHNVTIDLLDKKNQPKKLILLYAENGMGKSNIASSFYFLSKTLNTMNVRDFFERLMSSHAKDFEENEDLRDMIKARLQNLEDLIKENKMIDSNENMVLEFGFTINNKKGIYTLEFDNEQIVHEKLIFTITQRKGVFFDITKENIHINPKLFTDKISYDFMKLACAKYWGKHTLISILLHEASDKSNEFIRNKISKNFTLVLSFLHKLSCKLKIGNVGEKGRLDLPDEIISNFSEGKIEIDKEYLLSKTEDMLNLFFVTSFRDVKQVYYKKSYLEDFIKYHLVLKKQIANKIRDINISLESTGTQEILDLLPFILIAINGAPVIIDEFDNGIHDLLVQNLIESLYKDITGQLIITTHNTRLMESNIIPKESLYVINELEDGNKTIKCITYYNNKIGENNNIRRQYIEEGRYKGIPETSEINFKKLLDTLQ